MKKVLAQLVLTVVLLSSLNSMLFAKDMPIAKVWELKIPIQEKIIMEFPFKIVDVIPTPFVMKKTITSSGGSGTQNIGDFGLELPPPSSQKKDINSLPTPSNQQENIPNKGNSILPTASTDAKNTSLTIKKGGNNLELFAKNAGDVELSIWGYEHPILIKISFSELSKEDREKYFKFVDYSQKKEEITAFEQNGHEEVISKLTVALHNQKTPKGYKRVGVGQKIAYPDLGIDATLVYVLLGNKYAGEYWDITNTKDSLLNLHEPMFYGDGVFSVSFPNNQIPSGQTVQMFLVRNNSAPTKK